jgi:hypothetical protein
MICLVLYLVGEKYLVKIIDCEMIHLRRRSNSSIDHEKKNCGFSQLPACFSPDPPTSRLPSPSYNVTRITHPCIFVTRQIASETLNDNNCACCVYFYSHDCHVKFYEKGGQCTKFSFTLRRRRRNSVKSKLPGRLHGSLYTAL